MLALIFSKDKVEIQGCSEADSLLKASFNILHYTQLTYVFM